MLRVRCRVGTLLLLLAAPMVAQFTELAATDDGKQLFFTSQMLLKGREQTGWVPETRLYRFGADGVTVYAERGPLASESGFGSGDGISGARLSGDGGVVGFTYYGITCRPDPNCLSGANKAV